MASVRLSRRTFLRGVTATGTVCVGLPVLDAMLDDNGTALAQGTPIPKRIGIWFWGNGVRPEHFFPEGAVGDLTAVGSPGTSKPWDLTTREHTRPLAAAGLAPYLSLVTGTEVRATPEQAHHDGRTVVTTGSYEWFEGDPDRGYAGPVTPSFDQLAAAAWEGQTSFRSLQVGVQEGAANNEPGNAGHFVSNSGRDEYLRPEYSPLRLFNRLFMRDAQTVDPASPILQARRSILDAITGDMRKLNRDLGAKDRLCLDQHLTSIRELERRLSGVGAITGCSIPDRAPEDHPTVDGRQNLRGRSDSMSQILALALACDLTRAFSYQFTVFQTGHDFSQEPELSGAVDGIDPSIEFSSFHEAAHFESFQNNVRVVTNFTFENLAYTLRLLADIPEGDGSVLTNSAILCTSEHTEPVSHSTADLPMIIAGTAGGRLKGGQWYHGRSEKVAKGGLTLLRACGVEVERFGVPFANPDGNENNDPSTTETFTALEA